MKQDKDYWEVALGWGRGRGPVAPTHRYVEVDICLVHSHRGGVEACRVHCDGPGEQEEDSGGGRHQADEHRQEHGELPVAKQDGAEEWTSQHQETWRGLQTPLPAHTYLTNARLPPGMCLRAGRNPGLGGRQPGFHFPALY